MTPLYIEFAPYLAGYAYRLIEPGQPIQGLLHVEEREGEPTKLVSSSPLTADGVKFVHMRADPFGLTSCQYVTDRPVMLERVKPWWNA